MDRQRNGEKIMNIEIVEFYPFQRDDKRGKMKGSLHIYIVDDDIDLRGVYVIKNRDNWFFGLPQQKGVDNETKQPVRYPVFSYMTREKNDKLRDAIIEKGKEYIIKNFLRN